VKSTKEEGGGEWKVEIDVGGGKAEVEQFEVEEGGGGKEEGQPFEETIFSCGVKDAHKDLTHRMPAMEKWKVKSKNGRTTTVIEAFKIEHKETPRNLDLLNAVLEEVLRIADEEERAGTW